MDGRLVGGRRLGFHVWGKMNFVSLFHVFEGNKMKKKINEGGRMKKIGAETILVEGET
jgi:hypothetical protein